MYARILMLDYNIKLKTNILSDGDTGYYSYNSYDSLVNMIVTQPNGTAKNIFARTNMSSPSRNQHNWSHYNGIQGRSDSYYLKHEVVSGKDIDNDSIISSKINIPSDIKSIEYNQSSASRQNKPSVDINISTYYLTENDNVKLVKELTFKESEKDRYLLKTELNIYVDIGSSRSDQRKGYKNTINMYEACRDKMAEVANEGGNWLSENDRRDAIRTTIEKADIFTRTFMVPAKMKCATELCTVIKIDKDDKLGEVLETLDLLEETVNTTIRKTNKSWTPVSTINSIFDNYAEGTEDYKKLKEDALITRDRNVGKILTDMIRTFILDIAYRKASKINISVFGIYERTGINGHDNEMDIVEIIRLEIDNASGKIFMKSLDERINRGFILNKDVRMKPYIEVI